MEPKHSKIITIFILFLFLLATPCFSSGGSDHVMETEVFEIDYRGPETHSSVLPPPDHSHGMKKLPLIHKKRATPIPKPKSFRGANMGREAKKLHG